MKLKINYEDHVEAINAEQVGSFYRLTSHSMFLPLSPGDMVRAEDGVITGVVSTEPVFMVEAYFPINTPAEVVRAKAREWGLATNVTQPTALTVLVSSLSRRWIEDVVKPAVWWVELIRVPGTEINYTQEVQQA